MECRPLLFQEVVDNPSGLFVLRGSLQVGGIGMVSSLQRRGQLGRPRDRRVT